MYRKLWMIYKQLFLGPTQDDIQLVTFHNAQMVLPPLPHPCTLAQGCAGILHTLAFGHLDNTSYNPWSS